MGPGKDLCGPHQVDGTKKPLDEVGVLHLRHQFLQSESIRFHPPSAPSVKTFPFSPDPNQIHNSRHPVPREGRSPSSRTFGDRDAQWSARRRFRARKGIAGRASVCERSAARRTSGAVADGKAVWSWHPLLVSSRRRCCSSPTGSRKPFNSPMTVARRIRRRGERDISR